MTSGIVEEAVERVRAARRTWPAPTVGLPDDFTTKAMADGWEVEATDGCEGIELDGWCEHGHPSWPLELGMI